MKLELIKYKKVYSYTDNRDDHTVDEMCEIFLGLLKSSGYCFREKDELMVVNEEDYP